MTDMTNPQLTRRAIIAHFACDKRTLLCDLKLEFYTSVANDFLNYLVTGNKTDQFERALKHKRYQIKMKLIERYIKNNKQNEN